MANSSIPVKHQIEIMDWLRENKDLFNKEHDTVVYAKYYSRFRDKLTGEMAWWPMTKPKFTRFLRSQGIVRSTSRINGYVAHVYVIDANTVNPNSTLEYRHPEKVVCPHCDGTGSVSWEKHHYSQNA